MLLIRRQAASLECFDDAKGVLFTRPSRSGSRDPSPDHRCIYKHIYEHADEFWRMSNAGHKLRCATHTAKQILLGWVTPTNILVGKKFLSTSNRPSVSLSAPPVINDCSFPTRLERENLGGEDRFATRSATVGPKPPVRTKMGIRSPETHQAFSWAEALAGGRLHANLDVTKLVASRLAGAP